VVSWFQKRQILKHYFHIQLIWKILFHWKKKNFNYRNTLSLFSCCSQWKNC
jgi:hypothetical protein